MAVISASCSETVCNGCGGVVGVGHFRSNSNGSMDSISYRVRQMKRIREAESDWYPQSPSDTWWHSQHRQRRCRSRRNGTPWHSRTDVRFKYHNVKISHTMIEVLVNSVVVGVVNSIYMLDKTQNFQRLEGKQVSQRLEEAGGTGARA